MKRGVGVLSFGVTCVILGLLVFSGPAQAFTISINSSSAKASVGETVSFIMSIELENDRLPIDYLYFELIGPQNVNCMFYADGTVISGCSGIGVSQLTGSNFDEGNLSGNYSGSIYNWGYGYGYGSGGALSYNVTLNSSNFPEGIYSTRFRVKINSDYFSKIGNNITLVIPISITSLPASPSCAYETDNITVSANITGSVQEVLVETNYGNKTITNLGTVYSALVNGIGGQNLSWRFVVRDIAGDLNYGSWNSQYIVKRTILTITPVSPDGLGNWYVSEPVFTLDNSDASQKFYRWDGTGNHLYASQFNLTDIPNPPPETAGILKLTYWSNTSCGIEQEQSKTIYVDLTNPRLENLIPAEGAVINDNNPIISAVINEIYGSNSGVNKGSIVFKLDNIARNITKQDITSSKVRVSYNSVNLSEGEHLVELEGQDNAGNLFSGNWSFSVNSSSGFILNINLPEETLYPKKQILLNVGTSSAVSAMEYIDYSDLKPRFKTLCRNCKEYSKKLTFSDGIHNLTVRATDEFGNSRQESAVFSIDSRLPKIIKTEPRRGEIVNGSEFYIKYSEDNLKSIFIYHGNESEELNCTSGNNQECKTNLNLSDYNGDYLDYWFVVSDYLRNVSSKTNRIKVDT
ncbi:MAG: hypothetical protein KKE50_01155, partial [Nanoarchaeota archaeon]|nr:hypothetical protein [Nanoarchaeota archaeon]